jgi:transcriptional regulator with XRE-family HTH domain
MEYLSMLVFRIPMRPKWLDLLYNEEPILPNKFTIALGELIRKARIDAKISQAELAERAHLKQSSISKIETGVRPVSTEELLYLSDGLDKPISYFFPKEFTEELGSDEANELEEELLIQARRLRLEDLRKLIAQTKAIAEYRPPKDRPLTSEEQQQVIDLLGLKASKKSSESTKKRRKKK